MTIRVCKKCQEVKDIEEFAKTKNKNREIAIRHTCDACEKKQRKIYNDINYNKNRTKRENARYKRNYNKVVKKIQCVESVGLPKKIFKKFKMTKFDYHTYAMLQILILFNPNLSFEHHATIVLTLASKGKKGIVKHIYRSIIANKNGISWI